MGEKRAEKSRFATLNVRGGMDDKIDTVCKMMADRYIDVFCVNETKRKGCGITKYGKYTAYWTGVPTTSKDRQGVGVILSSRMKESMREYQFVHPKLLWIRLKIGLTRLIVLGIYAPDMGSGGMPEGVN